MVVIIVNLSCAFWFYLGEFGTVCPGRINWTEMIHPRVDSTIRQWLRYKDFRENTSYACLTCAHFHLGTESTLLVRLLSSSFYTRGKFWLPFNFPWKFLFFSIPPGSITRLGIIGTQLCGLSNSKFWSFENWRQTCLDYWPIMPKLCKPR